MLFLKLFKFMMVFMALVMICAAISLKITKYKCKDKTQSQCIKIEKPSGKCSLLSCTWKYQYKGTCYTKSRKHPFSFNRPYEDETRDVYINTHNPKEFYEPIRDDLFVKMFLGAASFIIIILSLSSYIL